MSCSSDLDGGFGDAELPRVALLPTNSPLKLGFRSLSADEDCGQMDGSPSIFDDLIAWGACRLRVLQGHKFTAGAGSRLCMTHLQWQLMHGDDGFESVLNCTERTELNAFVFLLVGAGQ